MSDPENKARLETVVKNLLANEKNMINQVDQLKLQLGAAEENLAGFSVLIATAQAALADSAQLDKIDELTLAHEAAKLEVAGSPTAPVAGGAQPTAAGSSQG